MKFLVCLNMGRQKRLQVGLLLTWDLFKEVLFLSLRHTFSEIIFRNFGWLSLLIFSNIHENRPP